MRVHGPVDTAITVAGKFFGIKKRATYYFKGKEIGSVLPKIFGFHPLRDDEPNLLLETTLIRGFGISPAKAKEMIALLQKSRNTARRLIT